MSSFRVCLAPAFALLLSGCGFVHFGRLPEAARPLGEGKTAEALSNLSTENKILKQELTLARREGDTLRRALERTGGTTASNPVPSSSDAVARLNETTAELATLRASYAKLQAERGAGQPGSTAQLQELEEKLAATLRERTQLQSENAQLRSDVDAARRENATLAEKLQAATRHYDAAQITLAQLNSELVAQKQARSRAEQATDALRTQLSAVVAQAAATGVSPLQSAREPSAPASSGVELRTSAERLRQQAAAAAAPTSKPTRKHTVQAGDTLEKLAQRYYGAPDRWRSIYDANTAQLSNGQPLRPGTELSIPE